MSRPLSCAIYARVSTEDKGQDTENQLLQLRDYCARSKWTIAGEYIDHVSGKSGDRPAFQRLLTDASRRKFDVVLCWALDRFTREGIYQTFGYIERLKKAGIEFYSYSEEHFRTPGIAGEIMLALAALFAKYERERISERTKAGLARARRQGRCGGRPAKVFRRDRAEELRRQGMSWRAIGRELGVPQSTIRLALSGVQKT